MYFKLKTIMKKKDPYESVADLRSASNFMRVTGILGAAVLFLIAFFYSNEFSAYLIVYTILSLISGIVTYVVLNALATITECSVYQSNILRKKELEELEKNDK